MKIPQYHKLIFYFSKNHSFSPIILSDSSSSLLRVGSVLIKESEAEHIILQFFQYDIYLPFLSLSRTSYFSGIALAFNF